MFCALGCSPTKNLYIFPSRKHDKKRRKAWLDFFDMEEPDIGSIFACERHFSSSQTTTNGIRAIAVPDIPITSVLTASPFRRKQRNWRKNVVVVTPRDPEFTIYRHETGVFPQDLFNVFDDVKPIIQTPIIKSVSCSVATQTNTRLCGFVQISDLKEEYSVNCFYCSEVFAIEKWSKFVYHIKNSHLKKEDAFKISNYFVQDHDYASMNSMATSTTKFKVVTNSFTELPSQPVVLLPPLLAKPIKHTEKLSVNLSEDPCIKPPPLLAKPNNSNEKLFNISLADQLIKLLNETVLSPAFLTTEEDNILILKNTGSDNIETSDILKNLMNPENSFVLPPKSYIQSNNCSPSTTCSRYTRPIYTINNGLQDIPLRRHTLSRILLPPHPKSKMAKLVKKRIAKQTLKHINIFENIYKTLKTRYPKVDEVENINLNDSTSDKVNERQISNLTPLNRCLKRTTSSTAKAMPMKQKAAEIVFEYTPADIIVSLLERMKNFPVLWEFHDEPFNKNYNNAIDELCRFINSKWSLNITLYKMRRSLNRILKFYRCMLPSESIDRFEDYFDKCALFLPSSGDEIPRARCPYCCVCYKKDSELRKHIIERHKSLKWPYKCQHCLERFRESDEYELHKRLPHYEEIFKCETCEKRFNRRHLYNKHVGSHQRSKERRMEEATELSDACNKKFKNLPELKVQKFYHEAKLFKCHMCPKEYCLKPSLNLHLKRHRNELDFICEVCGKGFLRKVYLEEHMAKHTGAKVTCSICNLKLRKCSLSRHLRLVHVAIEGTVESTFRSKSYRYNVSKRVRKPFSEEKKRQYICKTCKISFVSLKQLKDHNKQAHSDVIKTPCQICKLEFLHRHNLKRHYCCKHKLHPYQVFKLLCHNEDLNTVLAMKPTETESLSEAHHIMQYAQNNQGNPKEGNYFEQERMHSDKIQDEIMKAVENLDEQKIKVDDDRSMNDFFTDLLKNS